MSESFLKLISVYMAELTGSSNITKGVTLATVSEPTTSYLSTTLEA